MKKILIADKDESLKDAFRVVFPSDEYEIIFTSNGKDIEKISEEYRPEIYILNTKLDKKDGLDIYKELKEKNMLQNVRFFFMKDEGAELNTSSFPVDGVIEKPINFFRVHQMIDQADTLPELKIPKKSEDAAKPKIQFSGQAPVQMPGHPSSQLSGQAPSPQSDQMSNNLMSKEKTNMFEDEIKKVLFDSIENIKMNIVEKISPLIGTYIQEKARAILNETAEKLVREEMDKLLTALRESRK